MTDPFYLPTTAEEKERYRTTAALQRIAKALERIADAISGREP